MSEDKAEKALGIANKIANAIKGKFPKHSVFVRRYEQGTNGFIELALRPEGAQYSNHDITTAYSDEYFLSATQANINDKAKRIYGDFKINVIA